MEGRTYRYYRGEPLFPFGFGLSYTSFVFSEMVVPERFGAEAAPAGAAGKQGAGADDATGTDGPAAAGEATGAPAVEVDVTVANSGDRRGKVAAQLYLKPPEQQFRTPRASLRGVRKVELAPGETRRLTFRLRREDFRIYDGQGRAVVPRGDWSISVGACSPGKRGVELGAPTPATATISVE